MRLSPTFGHVNTGKATQVLLVERDSGDAHQIRELLADGHFDVECVDRLAVALRRLGEGAADVVLLNPSLPDSQGLDALAQVRGCAPQVPVVVFTDLPDEAMAARVMREGAQAYLVKGQVEGNALARTLRHALERKYAGEALRESEQRFRRVFEEGPIGMALVGSDLKVVSVNSALCRMLGYSAEELTQLTFPEFTHPDDIDKDVQLAKQVFRGEIPHYKLEKRYIRKDKTVVWGMLTASVVRNDVGKPLYGIAMVEDVTERKRAEGLLRESEERFLAMTDASPVGMFLVDAQGKNVYSNHAWCQMTGYTFEDALGEGWSKVIHPKDRDRVFSEWETYEGSRTIFDQVLRYLCKDGKVIWVRVRVSPIPDGTGHVGVVEDITERKRADELLRESEEKYRRLIENLPEHYFYRHGTDGVFTYLSPSVTGVLGYSVEEYQAHYAEYMTENPINSEVARHTELGLRGIEQPRYEVEVYHKDGSIRTLEVQEVPVYDEEGMPTAVEGVAQDISERKKAEEALRRYGSMVSASSDLMVFVDATYTYQAANPASCDAHLKTQDEILGHTVAEVLGQKLFETQIKPQLDRCLSGERVNFGFWWDSPGRGRLHADAQYDPFYDADGSVSGVLVDVRDTTDSKKAEEALKKSEQRLAKAQEIGRIGSWEWDIESDKAIWSDQTYRMFGFEPGEIDVTFESLLTRMHPDDRERVGREIEVAVNEHKAIDMEYRVFRKDGNECVVHSRGEVTVDETGKPIGLVGVIQDITERTLVEEKLRRSEAKYRELVEHAAIGIYRSTADGRFLAVNPALVNMLGYESEAELLSIDMGKDLYRDAVDRARLVKERQLHRQVGQDEVEWRRKDGGRILVRLSGRPIYNEAGALEGFEMVAEDITERRELETQLRHAQKMEAVGELTGGIAHDLNNILTVVQANVELVADSLPASRSDLRADIEETRTAARRGIALIKKLLGFSRRSRLEVKPLDIVRLITELLEMLRRVVSENIEIELSVDGEPGTVRADAGAVEQILVNLVTNARDAMPQGGVLRLDMRQVGLDEDYRATHPWARPGRYVCISVSDTGTGMDEETRERVFEPFFTTKPVGIGTGLGLAMVYGLVKQHGGMVDVHSEVGEGTTVKLYFPLVDRDTAAVSHDEMAGELRGGTETILVVEDEKSIRRATRRILEKFGYNVLLAADGQEALELCGEHGDEIDLIMSDVVMPRLGGVELYEALSEQGDPPRMLFISGYADRGMRGMAAIDLQLPFLQKPWTITELMTKVRVVLDSKR